MAQDKIKILFRNTLVQGLAVGKIINIGCSAGNEFPEAVNVDICSLEDLRKESKNPNLEIPNFVQADGADLPFDDLTFDTAVCFRGDVKILGTQKEIKEITTDDIVLNSNSKNQNVLKKFERTYFGDMIQINPSNMLPFDVTEDHPIYIANVRRIHREGWKKGMKHKYEYVAENHRFEKAKNITEDDWLLIPRNKKVEEKYIQLRTGRGHNNYDNRKKRKIKINDKIAFLFGLWVAEGTTNPKRHSFYYHMGSHEVDLINKIAEYMKEELDINSTIYKRKKGNTTNVQCYCKDLAIFLEKYFGRGAHNKKIPTFIKNSDIKNIKSFIKGLHAGDGDLNNGYNRITTCSKQLIYDLIELFVKLGISYTIYERNDKTGFDGGGVRYSFGYGKLAFDGTRDKANRKACMRMKFLDDFAYIPIRDISKNHVDNLKVYNIQTEDNTYCMPFLVHNCGEILEHVDDPKALLNEAQRVAKTVIFSVPNEYQWAPMNKPFWNKEHKHFFKEESILKLCDDAGLKLLEFVKMIYLGWSYFVVLGISKNWDYEQKGKEDRQPLP